MISSLKDLLPSASLATVSGATENVAFCNEFCDKIQGMDTWAEKISHYMRLQEWQIAEKQVGQRYIMAFRAAISWGATSLTKAIWASVTGLP